MFKEKLKILDKIFINNYEKNDILLTNNIDFKEYIKNKYKCFVLNTNICHLGTIKNDVNDNTLVENLLEFFLQIKSKKIKTYSDYSWISGFVYWNSLIHDIPLINMKEKITYLNENELETIEIKTLN
jgi:hypothetical protein